MLNNEAIQRRFMDVGPFDKSNFVKNQFEPITVEWIREFVKELGLPIELRPYQERIVVKSVNHFLVDGLNCLLVESATGSGKTVMGLTICLVLRYFTGGKTSWTTLRRELLKQANGTNKDLFLENVDLKTISMMSKNPDANDILVVDEAHKDATASMQHIHAHVNARFIILLSATPIRSDKATIFYDKIIKDAGIRALIRDGWLSKFDLYNIPEWTPEWVARVYLENPKKWGKSAVFFHKSSDCEEFVRLLDEAGVLCELVTGKSDREVQLQRFENGDVPVLVNMMVLTEGFDCPSLETVFVRDSQRSTTIQMAGRVLRLWDNVDNISPRQANENTIIKNVVQSCQTSYPFVKEATPETKYTIENGEWKEIGQNNRVNEMYKKMMKRAMEVAKAEALREKTLKDHEAKKKGMNNPAVA